MATCASCDVFLFRISSFFPHLWGACKNKTTEESTGKPVLLLFGFLFQRYLCKVGVLNKFNDLWAPTNRHLKRPLAALGPVIYAVTFVEVEIRWPDVLTLLTVLRCPYQNVWNLVWIVLLQPRSTSLGFTPHVSFTFQPSVP